MMKIKTDKNLFFNVAFIAGLIIFVVIVFHLPVNYFIVAMPVFAGLIFLSILIFNTDDKKKD